MAPLPSADFRESLEAVPDAELASSIASPTRSASIHQRVSEAMSSAPSSMASRVLRLTSSLSGPPPELDPARDQRCPRGGDGAPRSHVASNMQLDTTSLLAPTSAPRIMSQLLARRGLRLKKRA